MLRFISSLVSGIFQVHGRYSNISSLREFLPIEQDFTSIRDGLNDKNATDCTARHSRNQTLVFSGSGSVSASAYVKRQHLINNHTNSDRSNWVEGFLGFLHAKADPDSDTDPDRLISF